MTIPHAIWSDGAISYRKLLALCKAHRDTWKPPNRIHEETSGGGHKSLTERDGNVSEPSCE